MTASQATHLVGCYGLHVLASQPIVLSPLSYAINASISWIVICFQVILAMFVRGSNGDIDNTNVTEVQLMKGRGVWSHDISEHCPPPIRI